jgi:hypothetical protein
MGDWQGAQSMAETGKFECPKCDRTFSMASHLGRHMHTIHGPKKPTARAKPAAKLGMRPGVRRAAFAARQQPAIADGSLASVINELRAYRDGLGDRRSQFDTQIAAVEGALAALRANMYPVVTRARRTHRAAGHRQGSLREFIERVLRARRGVMSVQDVTTAVRKAGYQTKNKKLDKKVQIALANLPNVIRVARGQYRLRS